MIQKHAINENEFRSPPKKRANLDQQTCVKSFSLDEIEQLTYLDEIEQITYIWLT